MTPTGNRLIDTVMYVAGSAILSMASSKDDVAKSGITTEELLQADDGTLMTWEAARVSNGLVMAQMREWANSLFPQKSEIPTVLKNPNALTIKIGDTTVTYDGSEAKTIEIPTNQTTGE